MSVSKSDAERAKAQNTTILGHYRAIGPAAVLAAVLAAKKTKASTGSTKAA